MPRPRVASRIPRFSVTEITQHLQDLVREAFPRIQVEGELGRITFHRSGHWYLTLKDDGAVLNAAMFRNDNRRLSWRPREGDRVRATGRLDLYPPRGSYNLIIRDLERAGQGDLLARFEALRKRLTAEGLFAPEKKRPLPAFPRAVGVVTSPTGAAIRDVMRVTQERFPGFPLVLSPCRVQGDGAAAEVVAALARLAQHAAVDAVLLTRGGGAWEDLWTFNEEPVVRAVAHHPRPVVSAVGHEVDVTLADLAADHRAATPSHGAECIIPDRAGWLDRVAGRERELHHAMKRRLDRLGERLTHLRQRLRDPRARVEQARILRDDWEERLVRTMQRDLERRRRHLARTAEHLHAVSPLAVLERGYAIARHEGRALRDAREVSAGDILDVRLARGAITAEVCQSASSPGPSSPGPASSNSSPSDSTAEAR